MTDVATVRYATVTAYLCPMTGEGLLVRPRPSLDMPNPLGGASLQAADWDHAVADLYRRGWDLSEDDDGDCVVNGANARQTESDDRLEPKRH